MLGAASASDDEPPPSDDEGCPTNRDQPHLRFEITSDDGFSVEADTIEGKASVTFFKNLHCNVLALYTHCFELIPSNCQLFLQWLGKPSQMGCRRLERLQG